MRVLRRTKFLLVYIGWIAFCTAAFFAVRGAEDPSRHHDRILSNDAARIAVAVLRDTNAAGFRGFEAVHVAYARAGEGAARSRWVVLCDSVPHTALRRAVVVELRAVDGSLIAIRKPVN